MSEIRWEPLEDGEYGNLYVNHSRNGESMEIGVLCDENETDFISRYTWSGWLPPNIRLCRAVEPQALEMPDGPGSFHFDIGLAPDDLADSSCTHVVEFANFSICLALTVQLSNGRYVGSVQLSAYDSIS